MKSRIILFVFLLCGVNIFAQNRTLGTWKMFMPYRSTLGVCDAGDKIYCAATKSVFSYEKSTGTIQTFDKSTGLYDLNIKLISYSNTSNVLVIAYANSNLDLLFNGTDVYNIPDIKNKATTGAIAINGISFYQSMAYISTDIGISEINLQRKEISNTYIIGSSGASVKVYSTTVSGNYIYAATAEGIKRASLSSSNLQDFNNWILFGASDSLPLKSSKMVEEFNNKVYAVIGDGSTDTLFEYNGTFWAKKFFTQGISINSLYAVNGNLYFTGLNPPNYSGWEGKIDGQGIVTIQQVPQRWTPTQWFESNGTSWDADNLTGLYKTSQGNIERVVPDGPYAADAFAIEAKNGVMKIAAGGVDDSWGYRFNPRGMFVYQDNKWIYHNYETDALLNDHYDFLSVKTISSSNKTYIGCYWGGLVEMDNTAGTIKTYDKTNSILEGAFGDEARTKISAMAVDRYDNLWFGNAGGFKPIKLIQPNGTWKEFSTPYQFDLMKKILIDQNDQLWAPLRGAAATGILVWSYNGTLDDPSDDKFALLKAGAGYGNLPDPVVYCLAEDKDGNIWAGTSTGIAVFYCPGSVLSSNGCDADQIKVERDGYVGYLFGTEIVRAIAVDAANRKWIGTSNGLWLISADGKTELLKFTAENSPLPENQITDIQIDEKTGEVFIGTIGGLVSYQGDAIADCSDCDAAIVYPNPVKPDYDGPIAIKGLADNAYVKITDVAGTLIYQGKANGCQMIWNGKGYNGNRAKSGVYLVFSSTDAGKEKRVGKILIAN